MRSALFIISGSIAVLVVLIGVQILPAWASAWLVFSVSASAAIIAVGEIFK